MCRYLTIVLVIFQPFSSSGQEGKNAFKLSVINNSSGQAIISALHETDTVLAGKKRFMTYDLGDAPLSFYLDVITTDTSSSAVQHYSIHTFNTSSKEILITPEGKLAYELTPEEEIADKFKHFFMTKNFWKLDSIIRSNNNNIIGADIIYWSICNPSVPTDTIWKYYNMLTPGIRSTGFGKKIINYLENKSQLAIGKTFNDFELLDRTGQMIKLREIKSDYILLDIWHSRCGPCLLSFPDIEKLYWKTKRAKLAIVGISVDEKTDHELWLTTLMKYYMSWINVNDAKLKVTGPLPIAGYPTRILLDKNRKIVLLDIENDQKDFFQKVEKLTSK